MRSRTTVPLRTADLAPQLRFAVLRLSRRLRQHAPEGITPSQLSALAVVVREGPLTLSQLAEAERVQPPTVTRIVDALGQQGLVTRAASDDDRRVAFVAATAEGRALVEAIRCRRDAYLAERLRTFTPDELAVLERAAPLLERLLEEPGA